jgi:hypothetical protein
MFPVHYTRKFRIQSGIFQLFPAPAGNIHKNGVQAAGVNGGRVFGKVIPIRRKNLRLSAIRPLPPARWHSAYLTSVAMADGKHHAVALDQSLTPDPALEILIEAGIQHPVGNAVDYLVRMPLLH